MIDNVRYFAALYGIAPGAADDAIRNVGLSDHGDDYSGNLSGANARVSLACALVCQPDLLVLDRPTVGLDPSCGPTCGISSAHWRGAAPRC